MPYVALYRKYRSQSFGEVVGQEHVTTVLRNALRLGRTAHAYLFCGPRGCGKTSTARLLARALNCQAAPDPTPEPCGTCSMCLRIRDGSCMDVVEMDAASETGIDDVREKIIENAKYMPAEARYKVYIIDEVHDLSAKAFDSLLKTLEEPPAHVVFILATTEAHKVPITIRSRCQRMDFRRGTLGDLIANLEAVLKAEGVRYEPEAVSAIARAAEGSFRDSLSLLEQALAYTEGDLTAEAVHVSVGSVGPQVLDDVTGVLAEGDMAAAFRKAGELVDSGKDVKQTLVALQAHLRDLLVAGIASGPQALADVSAERFAQLKEQASRFTPQQLLRMLDILAGAERDIRFTNQHRLLLERALWSILPTNLEAPAAAPVSAATPGHLATPAPERPPVPAEPRPSGRQHAVPSLPVENEPPVGGEPRTSAAPTPTVPPADTALATPAAAARDPRFTDGIDLDGVRRAWPRVVKRIVEASKAAVTYFGGEKVSGVDGDLITVEFPNEFVLSKVSRPKARELIDRKLADVIGPGYRVRCVLASSAQPAPRPAPEAVPPARLDMAHEPGPAAEEAAPPASPASPEDAFFALVIEQFNGQEVSD